MCDFNRNGRLEIITASVIDPDTGIYHSAFTDYLKNGAAYYYEGKRDFVLSYRKITESPIASKITHYHDLPSSNEIYDIFY